ncbi:MAG: hypothetical protein Q8Q09_17165 [Deltaproteobacteria bacterium]|nr:hypothetical protein [Deltaproteobacteria bacterium]
MRWIALGGFCLVLGACGARSGLRAPLGDVSATDAVQQDVPDRDASDLDAGVMDCRPNPRVLCDDGSLCTTDGCNAMGLCEHTPIVCEDMDPCTQNTCVSDTGCVFSRVECGGCADGVREAFRDRQRYPDIAGCAGGFSLQGLARETSPTCARGAGNDGPNPNGVGCSASDLCAAGFHVCRSSREVAVRSFNGCDGATDGPPDSFWATRQTGPGCGECATGMAAGCSARDCRTDCAPNNDTTNDIFGCGSQGALPRQSCAPLNRFGSNLCGALSQPWTCASNEAGADVRESEFIRKPGPGGGGILCCRD